MIVSPLADPSRPFLLLSPQQIHVMNTWERPLSSAVLGDLWVASVVAKSHHQHPTLVYLIALALLHTSEDVVTNLETILEIPADQLRKPTMRPCWLARCLEYVHQNMTGATTDNSFLFHGLMHVGMSRLRDLDALLVHTSSPAHMLSSHPA